MPHRDQRVQPDPLAPGAGTGGTGSNESPPPGEVVVGVDGSPGSLAALGWARTEASTRRVGLHAVIAWELPVESIFGAMVTVGDFHPVVAAEEALAKALAGRAPGPGSCWTATRRGRPLRQRHRARRRNGLPAPCRVPSPRRDLRRRRRRQLHRHLPQPRVRAHGHVGRRLMTTTSSGHVTEIGRGRLRPAWKMSRTLPICISSTTSS